MSNELALTSNAQLFAIATISEAVDFASQMAKAKLLPQHLQNSPADCLRVVMQASRWQMDPFAVAEKTSVISGKMMYEGQLVAAVVNSRGNLEEKLDYVFSGEGQNRKLVVKATRKGETEPKTIDLTHAQATRINKNGQMQQNPDQQMCYIGARMWARRWMPELLLGVYTPEEMSDGTEEMQNVTQAEERVPLPERSAKGVAAAKETAAKKTEKEPAKVVEGEFTDVKTDNKPATPPPEVKKPEPKPVEKVADTAGSYALKDKEVVTFQNLEVTDAIKKMIKQHADESMIVDLKGAYTGKAYHLGGGANPAWIGLKNVNVTLSGHLNKAGGVIAFVDFVQPADAATADGDDIS